MHFAEKARQLRGVFTMKVIDRDGQIVDSYEDHNMIVNLARVAMSQLVSTGAEDKIITGFGVGTGTATATPTDTALTDCYKNTIIGYSYPEAGTVTFQWRLGYDEANGMNVTEFGLFCEDGSLFSRKVREGIYKASDLSFEGTWSIIF